MNLFLCMLAWSGMRSDGFWQNYKTSWHRDDTDEVTAFCNRSWITLAGMKLKLSCWILIVFPLPVAVMHSFISFRSRQQVKASPRFTLVKSLPHFFQQCLLQSLRSLCHDVHAENTKLLLIASWRATVVVVVVVEVVVVVCVCGRAQIWMLWYYCQLLYNYELLCNWRHIPCKHTWPVKPEFDTVCVVDWLFQIDICLHIYCILEELSIQVILVF